MARKKDGTATPGPAAGRGGGESATSPRRIEAAEKQRRALQLRKGGATLDQICDALGYAHRGTVSRMLKEAMDALPVEEAADLRKLELARLDSLLAAMWPKAMKGDGWAVDRCLRVMERRAKLAGLDQPEQVHITTADTDFDRAYAELTAELAGGPPADPPVDDLLGGP